MAERNERGHFLPGHKIKGGRLPDCYSDKKQAKIALMKCLLMMNEPATTLELRLSDPNLTHLESLTLQAIKNKNYKHIWWLVEMNLGRPQPFDENVLEMDGQRFFQSLSDEELATKLQIISVK